MTHNLLGEPKATLLPAQPEADAAVAALVDGLDLSAAAAVAARFPAYSGGWALLADMSYQPHDLAAAVASYAYARTGYHRGLDALRRNGWKGHGPVPWSHEPNRGFLRALHALARAAEAISEMDEADRCAQFLRDCDPAAVSALA
jgi:hypothetical protein